MRRSLGSGAVARVRFERCPRQDPADYVLRRPAERQGFGFHASIRAADAVEALLVDGLERAQNTFHDLTGSPSAVGA